MKQLIKLLLLQSVDSFDFFSSRFFKSLCHHLTGYRGSPETGHRQVTFFVRTIDHFGLFTPSSDHYIISITPVKKTQLFNELTTSYHFTVCFSNCPLLRVKRLIPDKFFFSRV